MMNCEATYILRDIETYDIQCDDSNLFSLPKSSLKFTICFVLADHEYSGHPRTKMVMNPISEPINGSIVIKPSDPNSWALAKAGLAYLGVESDFHDEVVRNLHDHIKFLLDEYDKDYYQGVVWRNVDVYLLIRRFVKMRLGEKEVEILVNDNCAICLEKLQKMDEMDEEEDEDGDDLTPTLMPCNHFFHKKCIIDWFSVGDSCPLCRF